MAEKPIYRRWPSTVWKKAIGENIYEVLGNLSFLVPKPIQGRTDLSRCVDLEEARSI